MNMERHSAGGDGKDSIWMERIGNAYFAFELDFLLILGWVSILAWVGVG
jgi:hypothetical protein